MNYNQFHGIKDNPRTNFFLSEQMKQCSFFFQSLLFSCLSTVLVCRLKWIFPSRHHLSHWILFRSSNSSRLQRLRSCEHWPTCWILPLISVLARILSTDQKNLKKGNNNLLKTNLLWMQLMQDEKGSQYHNVVAKRSIASLEDIEHKSRVSGYYHAYAYIGCSKDRNSVAFLGLQLCSMVKTGALHIHCSSSASMRFRCHYRIHNHMLRSNGKWIAIITIDANKLIDHIKFCVI